MAFIANDNDWDYIYQSEEFSENMELSIAQNAIKLFIKRTFEDHRQSEISESDDFEMLSSHLYQVLQVALQNPNNRILQMKLAPLISDENISSLVLKIFHLNQNDSDTGDDLDFDSDDDFGFIEAQNNDITLPYLITRFLSNYSSFNNKVRLMESHLELYNQAPYKMHINFPLQNQLENSYLAGKEIKRILINAANEGIINYTKSIKGLLNGRLEIPLDKLGNRFINHAQTTIYLPNNPDLQKLLNLIEKINLVMAKYQLESKGPGVGDCLLRGSISVRRDYDENGIYKSATSADEKDLERNKETPLYIAVKAKEQEYSRSNFFNKQLNPLPIEGQDSSIENESRHELTKPS